MPTRARRSPAGLSLLALFAFGAATLVLLVAMRGYEAAATGASHHQLDISSLKAAREKQRHEWSAVSASVPTAPYAPPPPPIPAVASFYSERGCKGEGTDVRVDQLGGRTAFSWCDKGPHKLPSGKTFEGNVKSVRVSGTAELELLERCGEESTYWAHVVPSDGCTPIYAWPSTRGSVLRARVSPGLAARQSPVAWPPNLDAPSAARAWADGVRAEGKTPYRVVFSAESSTYQTTQTRCNRLAFERSGQHADGGRWTRLLTMNSADDVSTPFPTFWAPRHPYSRRYGPLNKPDVIVKWYASASAPVAGTDDVIVVIDPDNWLARSLQPWVAQVSVGHAVGQAAWFASAKRQVQSLWKIFCHNRCDEALDELDLVGVPYFVAREDLEKIAPLWRDYSIEMKDKADDDKAFAKRFQGLQIAWSTEMYGYVFAAAELGIRHKVLGSLQERDVGRSLTPAQALREKIPMIHMGRAFFPSKAIAAAEPFRHSEGSSFRYRGIQVWCKCNYTMADVLPWPLPPGTDWVSTVTLTMLHDAEAKFGPLPQSEFRKVGKSGYETPYH